MQITKIGRMEHLIRMEVFLETHIEFSGCFPQEPTFVRGDQNSVIDFAIYSTKFNRRSIELRTMKPKQLKVTTPHMMIIGTIPDYNSTILHKIKAKFNKVSYAATAELVMEILSSSNKTKLSANDFIGVVQRCIDVSMGKSRKINPFKLNYNQFNDPRLQKIRSGAQSATHSEDTIRRIYNKTTRVVQEESFESFLSLLISKQQ